VQKLPLITDLTVKICFNMKIGKESEHTNKLDDCMQNPININDCGMSLSCWLEFLSDQFIE